MAGPESSIKTGDTGRAQTAVVAVLALLAALQLLLIARTVWWPPVPPTAAGSQPPPHPPVRPEAERLLSPPAPGQLAGEPAVEAALAPSRTPGLNPPSPGMLAGEPALPSSPPSVPPVAESPAGGSPPMDPEIAELLETVAELRASGETESVLELLRAAEGMGREHPAVLKEFALTYEQMGFTDRAREYWLRIESLGSAAAGELHALARQKLQRAGDEVAVLPPPAANPVFPIAPPALSGTVETLPEAVLGIGPCQVARDATAATGDRRVLRIPILRLGDEQIQPSEVNVDVFFYDLVNGSRVEPTRADPPMANWVAMPVDWADLGAEPLDVVYHLPRLSMEDEAKYGIREYHGYVVKLYYRNRLQATAADPEDLLEQAASPAEERPSDTAP